MKYLALLRDSFREALDGKILYVTFGLSAILILLLASTSFRPVSVKEEVEFSLSVFNWAYGMQASSVGQKPVEVKLEHFEESPKDAPPFERSYKFTITIVQPNKGERLSAENHILNFRQALRGAFWYLKSTVEEPEETDENWKGRRHTFVVTSKGTRVDDLRDWPHVPALFFGLLPMSIFRPTLAYTVYWIENILVNDIGGWVIVLIGVIVTSFLIPSMLQKGSIDLLLVKPVSRPMLLLFKYLGGLTFVLVNSAVAIGGVWLVLGLRTGIWAPEFLLIIFNITYFFAILYAVSTLFAVLWRNSIICIFLTIFVWIILFALGLIHANIDATSMSRPVPSGMVAKTDSSRSSDEQAWEVTRQIIDTLHTVLPRTDDMRIMTTRLLSQSILSETERNQRAMTGRDEINVWESVGVSLAFIAVMLGLACWRFTVCDF